LPAYPKVTVYSLRNGQILKNFRFNYVLPSAQNRCNTLVN